MAMDQQGATAADTLEIASNMMKGTDHLSVEELQKYFLKEVLPMALMGFSQMAADITKNETNTGWCDHHLSSIESNTRN